MKTQIKPKQSPRRQNNIEKLVERGYALHLQQTSISEEMKTIKDQLKAEAMARPNERVPLVEKGSDGDQWIASGKGCECRIIFPGAKLRSELDPTDSEFAAIKSLAGTHFGSLFRKVTLFQPAEKDKFREQATALLSPLEATHLIELCSKSCEPKAVWKERSKE